MIVLDTNIISAMMQSAIHPIVLAWFNRQQEDSLYLPSIVVAEIKFGLYRMPNGQRKQQLASQFDYLVQHFFTSRVLAFAQTEANAYATIRATREAQGKPMSIADAQIAAITQVHQASLATRNIKDFEGCGILLINPFEPL